MTEIDGGFNGSTQHFTLTVEGGVIAMRKNYIRVGFTPAQSSELWDRWRKGEGLKSIGRVLGKPSSCIFNHLRPSGGIRPAERARSRLALTLAEREEISRGIAVGVSLRSIAGSLGRSPSTVSREIERNGGPARYRAAGADKRAWAVARRPKACKLARHPRLSPGGCGEAGAELVAGGDRQGRSPAGSSGDIRIIRPGTCRMRRSIAACSFRPVGC